MYLLLLLLLLLLFLSLSVHTAPLFKKLPPLALLWCSCTLKPFNFLGHLGNRTRETRQDRHIYWRRPALPPRYYFLVDDCHEGADVGVIMHAGWQATRRVVNAETASPNRTRLSSPLASSFRRPGAAAAGETPLKKAEIKAAAAVADCCCRSSIGTCWYADSGDQLKSPHSSATLNGALCRGLRQFLPLSAHQEHSSGQVCKLLHAHI